MSKFIVRSKWVEFFAEYLKSHSIRTNSKEGHKFLASFFVLMVKIAEYTRTGKCSFSKSQYREKAFFEMLKSQIDTDMELLKKGGIE
ncbi:MAG: hypothetical protein LUC37_05330 [Prevotella sp.]|nr:hypothetical protein [Prevotella sp.]